MTGEEHPIISDTHHPQDVPMSDEDMESYFNVSHLGEIADTNDRMKRKLMSDVLGHSYRGKPTFYLTPFNEETGFSKMSCDCGHCVGMDAVWKKLCPEGKAAAKRKFKVYPSAYANGWATQYCRGKFRGKKKK